MKHLKTMSVGLFQHKIYHYRQEFFDKLITESGCNIEIISGEKQNNFKLLGLFIYPGILKMINGYDILIVEGNIRYIQMMILPYIYPNKRIVYWGFWPTSIFSNWLRKLLLKNKNVYGLYYAKSHYDYFSTELNKNRQLIAYNSIGVKVTGRLEKSKSEKLRLIIVGTLNKRKEITLFLTDVFSKLILKRNVTLTIIGDGPELDNIRRCVNDLFIGHSVQFLGRMSDGEKLHNCYKNADLSICYGQAGLSVLQSLGYSTPVVALKGAISGGEIENVINNRTGYVAESSKDMLLWLSAISVTEINVLEKNSYSHYSRRDLKAMCNSFSKVLQ
jgi:glycosyltransferase involved in cell wall biosynthesis